MRPSPLGNIEKAYIESRTVVHFLDQGFVKGTCFEFERSLTLGILRSIDPASESSLGCLLPKPEEDLIALDGVFPLLLLGSSFRSES